MYVDLWCVLDVEKNGLGWDDLFGRKNMRQGILLPERDVVVKEMKEL